MMKLSARVPEWTVLIAYREPTYEEHRGLPPTEYRARFFVEADDESDARAAGLADFRAAVRAEGVSWKRDVVSVEVLAGVHQPQEGRSR